MFTIDKVSDLIEKTIAKIPSPAQVLPAELLYCTAMQRPGMSAYKIASQVISNNQVLGIGTGENPDGTPNMVNQYTYNIVKAIVDAIKNDCVIQAAIPTGSITVQVTGANAGGPVTCVGTNIISSVIKGLIR